MISIALLLVGRAAFGSDWKTPFWMGAPLIAGSFFVAIDFGGIALWLLNAVGLFILYECLVSAYTLLRNRDKLTLRSLAGRLALAGLGLALTLQDTVDSTVMRECLAIALAIDGLTRIPVIGLVRFPRWREAVTMVTVELSLSGIILSNWPLPSQLHVPLCLAVVIAHLGCVLLRFSHILRTTPDDVSVHASSLFGERNWNRNAAAEACQAVAETTSASRMRLWIWTPTGAADIRFRLPFIDQYLMAFDRNGKPSAGHSAIEVGGDLYISHWPVQEIAPNLRQVLNIFSASGKYDVEGMFPPSYAWECADWMPADRHVDFTRFNFPRLAAYWNSYRQSNLYNAGDRNCAIAVAGALETAMEGTMPSQYPWLRVMSLTFSPAIWKAAFLRSRARHMCWTPGMVFDYAQAFRAIVERSPAPAMELTRNSELEQFQRKWEPVSRPELRTNKDVERFNVSI